MVGLPYRGFLLLCSVVFVIIQIRPDLARPDGGNMIVNTITEAKAQLSALIEKALSGEEIIIKKAGKPVAVLHKFDAYRIKRHPGALKGQIDISDDFDELPSDIASAFGME